MYKNISQLIVRFRYNIVRFYTKSAIMPAFSSVTIAYQALWIVFPASAVHELFFVNCSCSLCKTKSITMITLKDAQKIIAAAQEKAEQVGQPMNIAVVDAGGNLISHVRMDGAWIGSIDISIKKAFTSRAFDISTKDLGENAQPNQQFYGIHASNDGKIMIFAGGIPLKKNGQVVGAIGVSGGSGEQDHAVAEAGVTAF